jgi:hypothetical protein
MIACHNTRRSAIIIISWMFVKLYCSPLRQLEMYALSFTLQLPFGNYIVLMCYSIYARR